MILLLFCVRRLFVEKLPKHTSYRSASKEDRQSMTKVMQTHLILPFMIVNKVLYLNLY